MNELTRIHLAKVPYEIEVEAKKDLEKYLKVLTTYADDNELLNDIEIRITELLVERSVNQNGVIVKNDIVAVRKKLGEPEDFADEDTVKSMSEIGSGTKKLYRNVDVAILGGVLSGIAKFFNINPLWVRLMFILLLVLTALVPVVIAYVILWVVVPPARTAAEKLQMNGEPVTLEKIKLLSESEGEMTSSEYVETTRRVLGTMGGIGFICLAFGSLAFTIFGSAALLGTQPPVLVTMHTPIDYSPHWPYIAAYCLIVTSGLLLTGLFIVLAVASFTRRFTKKIALLVVSIVVAGLLSFGSSIGLVVYAQQYLTEEISRNMEIKSVRVPDTFASTRILKADFASADVAYVVSDTPRIEYKAVSGTAAPTVTTASGVTTITNPKSPYPDYSKAFTRITVYGPALAEIQTDSGKIRYSGGSGELEIMTKGWAQVTLKDGSFTTVRATIADGGNVYANEAAVDNADVNLKGSGQYVQFGTVRTLAVRYPESCAYGSSSNVEVFDVTSGQMSLNGELQSAQIFTGPCAAVQINSANKQY